MTTSDSRLPEDFSTPAQDHGNRGLRLVLLLGMAIMLLVGLYVFFLPQDEIELAPPLDPGSIDPIIRAQIDAAKPAQAAKPAARADQPGETHTPAPPGEFPSGPQRDTAPLELATIAAPAAHKPGATVAPSDSGNTARKLIKSIKQGDKSVSLDQLYARAGQLQAENQNTDAYLLYFYAARKGHGASAFVLGTLNDPAHFHGVTELLEKPDPMQAYKWYSIAAANQVAGTEARLKALRSRVETAAADGDPSAQRLLLNWK